jgi:hypothetical protein
LAFSCSGRVKFEPLTDELHGSGQCGGAETEGALDEARLTANLAGDVEDRRLTFAERAHHLEAFDRRIGRLQRLEASDRSDQLLQLAESRDPTAIAVVRRVDLTDPAAAAEAGRKPEPVYAPGSVEWQRQQEQNYPDKSPAAARIAVVPWRLAT